MDRGLVALDISDALPRLVGRFAADGSRRIRLPPPSSSDSSVVSSSSLGSSLLVRVASHTPIPITSGGQTTARP
jgi:hypothetical protein